MSAAHPSTRLKGDGAVLKSVNPFTGETISEYKEMSRGEAASAVESAHAAYLKWRDESFARRSACMNKAAQILKDSKNDFAGLIMREMGKIRREAVAEIEKCAWVCEYYAENAEEFLKDEAVATGMQESFIACRPLGAVLAVMPWNFPFWQVFRFAAPNLMAGNAAVLKHACNVSGCALAIEEIFREAGFPENLFRSLLIHAGKVTDIIAHENIAGVTLTGSPAAGRAVAARAGECLKKTVLELGGSDPYVILEDADLEKAAAVCTASRLVNAGQSCIAAKRFIVPATIYNEFLGAFKLAMNRKKISDPSDNSEDVIGPLASLDQRDRLHRQVIASVNRGARCFLGGEIPEIKGAFYPPTILADVNAGMPACEEELFGPVAAVMKAKDDEDAIAIANSSSFGLGGAVFTRDAKKGREIARNRVESGTVVVNGMVQSDPRLPFGGIKDSGYGRELSWPGIREFVNVKTVSLA